MDIAALSIVMSNSKVAQSANIKIMDNIMNLAEQQGSQLMEMMQETVPVHPTLGNQIDVKL
ncbi:YjfB family protein [Oceanobacillus saliphilus]|uniref:YjfB family protein n=1 Tax=Oceanobacillus saliphilus TaxID=2925834 RepID=UPI00201D3668|nr:YjfB family protein [Oceanobacillus saliphilus]